MVLSRLGLGALLAILANTYSGAAGAGSNPVPTAHWSYRFLERCEAKGVLVRLGDGIKPFTRSEIASALQRIGEHRDRLSEVEQSELDLLHREFGLGADSTIGSGGADGSGGRALGRLGRGEPLMRYASPHGELFADLLLRNQIDLLSGLSRTSREKVYRNRLGGVVWGEAWQRVGLPHRLSADAGAGDSQLRDSRRCLQSPPGDSADEG